MAKPDKKKPKKPKPSNAERADGQAGIVDVSFGSLNPIGEPDVYTDYDPNTNSGVDTLKKVAAQNFTTNTQQSVDGYKAVCLRVDVPSQESPAGSWLSQVFFGEQPEILLSIKARIPEIDAGLPNPWVIAGGMQGGSSLDAKIVDMHTTFYAIDSSLADDPPAPGDIVMVDFGDRVNRKDPKYKGNIFALPVGFSAGAASGGSSRVSYKKSNGKMQTGTGGPPTYTAEQTAELLKGDCPPSDIGLKALEVAMEEYSGQTKIFPGKPSTNKGLDGLATEGERPREIGGDDYGPWVAKYTRKTFPHPKHPSKNYHAWCAKFVSYCFNEAAKRLKIKLPWRYTGSSWKLIQSCSKAGGLLVFRTEVGIPNGYYKWHENDPGYTPAKLGRTLAYQAVDPRKDKRAMQATPEMAKVQPGDIAWWHGHIGIVRKYDEKSGKLYTVEGNTGRFRAQPPYDGSTGGVNIRIHKMKPRHRLIAGIMRPPNSDGKPPKCK